LEQLPQTREIEVVVQAPAAVVERRLGAWSRVEAVDERSCRMTMHADQFEWPAMGPAQLDAEFAVVRPPEFAAYFARLGERFLPATS
jgi:hypothetical protein